MKYSTEHTIALYMLAILSLMLIITIIINYFITSHAQNTLCEVHMLGHFITCSFASNKITTGGVLGKLASVHLP